MRPINKTAVVIIGRNEGSRLINCIESVSQQGCAVVYVDSDSSDDSVENAQTRGAVVVNLDMSKPFSAARARNVGWKHILSINPVAEFIQFIDGDCELQWGWLSKAENFLLENPEYAVVCGRRRERYPTESIYNQICDEEWDTPIGETKACGGDALIRTKALIDVNGYKDSFIAGEEPEMCFRMRQQGWKIYRIDEEMTLHDANMLHFSQWWKRAQRTGFAYVLAAFEHGKTPEKFYVKQTLRSLFWTSFMFSSFVVLYFFPIVGLLMLTVFPLQILRTFLKRNQNGPYGWLSAALLVLGKLPETIGIIKFMRKKALNRQLSIIEYK